MPDTRKRPCSICRRWFRPDARVGARQRACRKPECQAARRKKTQAPWRARNPDHFIARRMQMRGRAAATGSKRVIVVEGYFDCFRVHQAGLPWVVALMGSSLSVQQERALLERFGRVVLLLDGDEAGRAASRAIAARLAARCLIRVVQLPQGAQPDQLSPAAIQHLLADLEMRNGTL